MMTVRSWAASASSAEIAAGVTAAVGACRGQRTYATATIPSTANPPPTCQSCRYSQPRMRVRNVFVCLSRPNAVASLEPPSCMRSDLLRDQVDQPVGNVDRAPDRPSAERPLDIGALLDPRPGVRLVDSGGDLDPVSQASVDLDDNGDLGPPELHRIDLRPALEDDEPLTTLPLPQLLRQVRREGPQQAGHVAADAVPRLIALTAGLQIVLHRVGQLHQGGHRGIEMKGVHVTGDLVDGFVSLSTQALHRCRAGPGDALVLLADDPPPHPMQKAGNPVNPAVVPLSELSR